MIKSELIDEFNKLAITKEKPSFSFGFDVEALNELNNDQKETTSKKKKKKKKSNTTKILEISNENDKADINNENFEINNIKDIYVQESHSSIIIEHTIVGNKHSNKMGGSELNNLIVESEITKMKKKKKKSKFNSIENESIPPIIKINNKPTILKSAPANDVSSKQSLQKNKSKKSKTTIIETKKSDDDIFLDELIRQNSNIKVTTSNDKYHFLSYKDPILTEEDKLKLKFGNGKNLVAIGPKKVRDNKWLGISTNNDTIIDNDANFIENQAENGSYLSTSSPFTFGFAGLSTTTSNKFK